MSDLLKIPEADDSERFMAGYLLQRAADGPALIDEIASTGLRPDHFRIRQFGLVLAACNSLRADSAPMELPAIYSRIKDQLGDMNKPEMDDFMDAFWKAAEWVGSGKDANWKFYANRIIERAAMRQWQRRGTEMSEFIASEPNFDEIRSFIRKLAIEAESMGPRKNTSVSLRVGYEAALDALEAATKARAAGEPIQTAGFPTGLPDLDHKVGGLVKGDLFVLAGRTRAGKSTLGCQIAAEAALRGAKVLIVEMEMTDRQVAERLIASYADISLTKGGQGNWSDMEWGRAARTYERLVANPPRIIDHHGAMRITDILQAARDEKLLRGLDVLVVDHLHRIALDGKTETLRIEVSNNIRSLKNLAAELGICCLVLAQANRATEDRKGHEPVLTDLKESGTIEEEADVVGMLHRPFEYTQKVEDATKATLFLPKIRRGQSGSIELVYNPNSLRYGCKERRDADQPRL